MAQLATLMHDNWAAGAVDAQYSLTMRGVTRANLRDSATGTADFTWNDGVLRHVVLDGRGAPLTFSEFTGKVVLANANVHPYRLQAAIGRRQLHRQGHRALRPQPGPPLGTRRRPLLRDLRISGQTANPNFDGARRRSSAAITPGVQLSHKSICIRARLQPCRKRPRYGLGFSPGKGGSLGLQARENLESKKGLQPRCSELFRSRVRRIGRVRRVHVNVNPSGAGWRIATAIGRIGLTAGRSHLGTPWRLRELPCIGKGHATARGSWRRLRKHAARRWTALVVADKEMYLAATGMVANIVRRHHGNAKPTRETGCPNSRCPRDSLRAPRHPPRHECRRAAQAACARLAPDRETGSSPRGKPSRAAAFTAVAASLLPTCAAFPEALSCR